MCHVVLQGFDAGIRMTDSVPGDMIAVRLGSSLDFSVVGSPRYFAQHPEPATPHDLMYHRCIRSRWDRHSRARLQRRHRTQPRSCGKLFKSAFAIGPEQSKTVALAPMPASMPSRSRLPPPGLRLRFDPRRARTPQVFLDSLRAQLGADIFAAQYRQRPLSPEGVMIKREWLRRYEELPRRALAEVVAVFTHPYGAAFSANLGNH